MQLSKRFSPGRLKHIQASIDNSDRTKGRSVAKGLSEFSNHGWNIPAEENVHKCTEVHAEGHVPRNDASNGPSSIDERRCKRASLFAILAKERLQSPG